MNAVKFQASIKNGIVHTQKQYQRSAKIEIDILVGELLYER